MIAYSAVYQFVSDTERRIRIVDINISTGDCAYVPMAGDRALPVTCRCEELELLLDEQELIEIIDPFYDVDSFSEQTEAERTRCDKRYQLVTKYWPAQKERLLNKSGRAEFLKQIALEEGVTESSLKRLFSQFLQQGMRKSTMFTSYTNSGGKGKNRSIQCKSGAKRSDNSAGMIVDERTKQIFAVVLKKYYETEKKPSLTKVYHQMLYSYFSKTRSMNGEKRRDQYDDDHCPTIRQFRYYFDRHIDRKESFIARETENQYKLKRRPIVDTVTNQIKGPGDCFMIDSTPGDIHLVSKSNSNRVIGRPTVYIIIDVFSRLITGCYIGIENPSWDAVSLALVNMVEDKVAFCESRGISINEEDWPSHHLPRAMLADRGEMISKKVEGVINELSVIVQNTAPYRGDMKGVVERFFRTMNNHLRETLPGGIQKDHMQRGDKDPKTEAVLTLKECERIIIQTILLHNATVVEDYSVTKEQIEDGVPSVPVQLWEYGISLKTGSLRMVDTEKMSLNVWPSATVPLSRQGLRFNNLFYGDIPLSEKAVSQQSKFKMKIVYNPFTVNYVYVLDGLYRKIRLLQSCSQFEDLSFSEYKDYRDSEHANDATMKRDNTQRRTNFEGMLLETKKEASRRRTAAPSKTKAYRTKNMKDHRLDEKMEERRTRTADLKSAAEPAKIIPFGKQPTKDYLEMMQDETASLMDELFGDKN